MKRVISFIMILALIICFTACSSQPKESSASTQEDSSSEVVQSQEESEEESQEEATAPVDADFSNPAFVIEYGDYDEIVNIGTKLQNFEIEEGTVIKISGICSTFGSSVSIMQKNPDGNDSRGLTLSLDENAEVPADNADIEITGVVQLNGFYLDLYVPAEYLKLL